MLSSLFWFLAGSLCAAALLRRASLSRESRMPRPRTRRAWLDRSSTMGAALPDPALLEREPLDFASESDGAPTISRERTRQMLDDARRALRPSFGITMRVRE